MASTTYGRYFEGVLQLRNPRKEIINFINSQLQKEGVKIAKEVFVSEGVDIYVTSRKFLRTLGARLKNQFGGEVILTARLHGQERTTQKGLYRVSLLYRAPNLKKGDVVVHGEHILKIKNVAKFVTGTDIKTGKQVSFLYSSGVLPLKIYGSMVVKIHPVFEVLHPETYQPVEIASQKPLKKGEKVKLVSVSNRWYIV